VRWLASIILCLSACVACAGAVTYSVKMTLHVPRVYNNTKSRGYRKYQRQTVKGHLRVTTDGKTEPQVEAYGFYNATHRVGGVNVRYAGTVTDAIFHAIGNNGTGKFKTASVCLSVDLDPSYNVGIDEPDNALVITMSGKGTAKRIAGNVAGQIGCGCRAYGHVSPTRIMWTDAVTDIAAVHGTFTMKEAK